MYPAIRSLHWLLSLTAAVCLAQSRAALAEPMIYTSSLCAKAIEAPPYELAPVPMSLIDEPRLLGRHRVEGSGEVEIRRIEKMGQYSISSHGTAHQGVLRQGVYRICKIGDVTLMEKEATRHDPTYGVLFRVRKMADRRIRLTRYEVNRARLDADQIAYSEVLRDGTLHLQIDNRKIALQITPYLDLTQPFELEAGEQDPRVTHDLVGGVISAADRTAMGMRCAQYQNVHEKKGNRSECEVYQPLLLSPQSGGSELYSFYETSLLMSAHELKKVKNAVGDYARARAGERIQGVWEPPAFTPGFLFLRSSVLTPIIQVPLVMISLPVDIIVAIATAPYRIVAGLIRSGKLRKAEKQSETLVTHLREPRLRGTSVAVDTQTFNVIFDIIENRRIRE